MKLSQERGWSKKFNPGVIRDHSLSQYLGDSVAQSLIIEASTCVHPSIWGVTMLGTLCKTPGILGSSSYLMSVTYTNPGLQKSMGSPIAEVCAKRSSNTEKGVAKYTNIIWGDAGKNFVEEVICSCALQCHKQGRQVLRPLRTKGTA